MELDIKNGCNTISKILKWIYLFLLSSMFQLAIAQQEERMYVEIAKIFENFVNGQSKVI